MSAWGSKFTRQGFLKTGGAALVTAGAASATGMAAAGGSGHDPLAHLRQATYEPLLHTKFRLDNPHGATEVELVEVAHLGPTKAPGEHFSLVFETSRGFHVAQGTYTLHHPAMAGFSLFLVPIGPGEKGNLLQAIVSRNGS